MKNKKIIIASGVLAVAGIAALVYYRRSAPVTTIPATASPQTPLKENTTTITQPTVSTAPQRVSKWPEGTLLRVTGAEKVFLIDQMGYRRHITSRGYFDSNGYKMSDVISISLTQMLAIPEGPGLGALAGFSRN